MAVTRRTTPTARVKDSRHTEGKDMRDRAMGNSKRTNIKQDLVKGRPTQLSPKFLTDALMLARQTIMETSREI